MTAEGATTVYQKAQALFTENTQSSTEGTEGVDPVTAGEEPSYSSPETQAVNAGGPMTL